MRCQDVVFTSLRSIAISPDGIHVAIASQTDEKVNIWNVTTGKQVGTFAGHRPGPLGTVTSLAFSPDGELLATGGADTTILMWDVTKLLDSFRLQGRD